MKAAHCTHRSNVQPREMPLTGGGSLAHLGPRLSVRRTLGLWCRHANDGPLAARSGLATGVRRCARGSGTTDDVDIRAEGRSDGAERGAFSDPDRRSRRRAETLSLSRRRRFFLSWLRLRLRSLLDRDIPSPCSPSSTPPPLGGEELAAAEGDGTSSEAPSSAMMVRQSCF